MEKIVQPIYEDNHLLIVNKPAGILVQGDSTGDKPLVDYCKEYIKEKYNKPGAVFLGVVHRIDRPVSGAVVFARTSKALERMNALFKNRKIQKTYWAIVKRKPSQPEGKLVSWLKKDTEKNITTAYDYEEEGSLKAELDFKLMGRLNDHYMLEVKPITGRSHQIRVQLSEFGCPIRGDLRYGFSKPNPDKSINLHARGLYFEHPIKKEPIIIRAGLPNDQFWEQFLALEKIKVKSKNIDNMY
ncbi:MAG: 23S rRNA pseudouridine1911/1915/1917 synthase [Roseivirga sp.]|jgi:23S rRNA pseudouridine1911/1915/1917 synthase